MAVNIKKVLGTIAYLGGTQFVPEPFCFSWGEMIQFNCESLNPDEQIFYDIVHQSYHSHARNQLVKRMKGDWLLMLDTDHRFDPDIALRMVALMEKYNIQVLSGLYQYKTYPYFPTVYTYDKKLKKNVIVADWSEGTEIFQIDAAGAGILMIKREVFDRIRNELKQDPFSTIGDWSEDISFFLRCKKLKIKTYVTPQVESNHLILKPITLEDRILDSHILSEPRQTEGNKTS